MIIGIFSHFFALETTLAERQFFRALARLIGSRAARLSACGIAAIVSKKGYLEEGCVVGADGSLYNVRPIPILGVKICQRFGTETYSRVVLSCSRNIPGLQRGYMRACKTF